MSERPQSNPPLILNYQGPRRKPPPSKPTGRIIGAAIWSAPGTVWLLFTVYLLVTQYNIYDWAGVCAALLLWIIAVITSIVSIIDYIIRYWKKVKPWYAIACLTVNAVVLLLTTILILFRGR